MREARVFNSTVSNNTVAVKILLKNESFEKLEIVVWRNLKDQPSLFGEGIEGMSRRMVTFQLKIEKQDLTRNLKTNF